MSSDTKIRERALRYQDHFQKIPVGFTNPNFKTVATKAVHALNIRALMIQNPELQTKVYETAAKLEMPREDMIQILRTMHQKIVFYTKDDLYQYLMAGVQWLFDCMRKGNNQIPEYGLLTESLYNNLNPQKDTDQERKSPEWIANVVWTLLQQKPKCVSDVHDMSEESDLIEYMRYRAKIYNFVLFDDGAYSGIQKAKYIFETLWEKLNEMKHFNIYVVIPFMTETSVRLFVKSANKIGLERKDIDTNTLLLSNGQQNVYIWTGGVKILETYNVIYSILSEKYPGVSKPHLKRATKIVFSDLFDKKGTGLIFFEHKIPDAVSFPEYIAENLLRNKELRNHYESNPIYKKEISVNDISKTFPCATQLGGDGAHYVMYEGKQYRVRVSLRGNEYIVGKNNQHVYIKNFKKAILFRRMPSS